MQRFCDKFNNDPTVSLRRCDAVMHTLVLARLLLLGPAPLTTKTRCRGLMRGTFPVDVRLPRDTTAVVLRLRLCSSDCISEHACATDLS
jgi:hypothetical protein